MTGSDSSVAVIGLGKLGLPLACVLAARGKEVWAIDKSPSVVKAICHRNYLGPEPRVAQMLATHGGRIRAAEGYEGITHTRTAFVVVNTPNVAGRFSLQQVLPAVRRIARRVRDAGLEEYTVVIVSTVMPGDCQGTIQPAIDQVAGAGRIQVAYCPEFVALGHVIDNMLRPEYIVVGSVDCALSQRVARFYGTVVRNRPEMHIMNLVNAEITKLALNVAVSFKITCANLLAQVCQAFPGGDVDQVTRAVGGDSRIGQRYFRGGLGYAGPCFPRDVQSLGTLCRELALGETITTSVERFNNSIPARLKELVLGLGPRPLTVGVLGLGFRAGTGIDKDSQAVALVEALLAAQVPVVVYDPQITHLGSTLQARDGLAWCATLEECLLRANTIVIATEDESFRSLPAALCTGKTLIDCWRRVDLAALQDCFFRYFALGRGVGFDDGQVPSRSDSPTGAVSK